MLKKRQRIFTAPPSMLLSLPPIKMCPFQVTLIPDGCVQALKWHQRWEE